MAVGAVEDIPREHTGEQHARGRYRRQLGLPKDGTRGERRSKPAREEAMLRYSVVHAGRCRVCRSSYIQDAPTEIATTFSDHGQMVPTPHEPHGNFAAHHTAPIAKGRFRMQNVLSYRAE